MRGADRVPDPFAVDALHTLLGLYVFVCNVLGKGVTMPSSDF